MNRWAVRILGVILILALMLVLIGIQNRLKQLAASRKPAAASSP